MANILHLHQSNAGDVSIIGETKRRIWWTLVMADSWCSAGISLPKQLHNVQQTASLPIDEHVFQCLRPTKGSVSPTVSPHHGLWGYMITLVDIFESAQKLNRCLIEDDEISEHDVEHQVSRLAYALGSWKLSLPPDYEWSAMNLEQHCKRGTGGAFVAMFLGFHHYATLLYYQYLDHQRSSNGVCAERANECRQHAVAYSEVLAASRSRSGCEAYYATVGHMTVVSSSVILHSLFYGGEADADAARESLSSNFEALIQLQTLWPSLSRTVRCYCPSVVYVGHEDVGADVNARSIVFSSSRIRA